MKINKATLGYLKCTLFQWVFSVCSQQFTLSVTSKTRFFNERSLLSYAKKKKQQNSSKFCWDAAKIILWHNSVLSKSMGSKGHFERIGSNLVTLLYLLQTVDAPFPQQLDIPQEPIVHRLLLQPVVCSCQKERCEKQARGIARGKRKRRGTQMWTGERSPFSPSPWRLSFSYARFSGSACPDYSGTSPLGHLYSRDTSIQGTQKCGAGKMFT